MEDEFMFNESIESYSAGLGAITFITQSYVELKDIIEEISSDDEFRFNIGLPKMMELNETVVLSISSILFFDSYNLLRELSDNFDVHILIPTLEYFIIEKRELLYRTNNLKKKLRLSYEEQRLKIELEIEKNEKYLQDINNIIDWMNECKIIEVYGSYEISDNILDGLSYIDELFIYSDLDSAQYANRMDYRFLIDDKITIDIFKEVFDIKEDRVSNLAGFVNTVYGDKLKEYYPIIKKLLKSKYSFVLDKSSIINISKNAKESEHEELDNVLKLLVEEDVYGYYKSLIKDILKLDIG